MAKIIKIKKCSDCPHSDHTGAFTEGGAKPCCNHPKTVERFGSDCFKRVIPFNKITVSERSYNAPKRIPVFCPLESYEENIK